MDRRRVVRTMGAGLVAVGSTGCLGVLRGPPDPVVREVNAEEGYLKYENRGGEGAAHLFVSYADDQGRLLIQDHRKREIPGKTTVRWNGVIRQNICGSPVEASMHADPLGGSPDPTDVSATGVTCSYMGGFDGEDERTRHYALARFKNDGSGGTVKTRLTVRFPDDDDIAVGPRPILVPPNTETVRTMDVSDPPEAVDGKVWVD
jgi:hypothetical protein